MWSVLVSKECNYVLNKTSRINEVFDTNRKNIKVQKESYELGEDKCKMILKKTKK